MDLDTCRDWTNGLLIRRCTAILEIQLFCVPFIFVYFVRGGFRTKISCKRMRCDRFIRIKDQQLYENFMRTKGRRSPTYENLERTKYSRFTVLQTKNEMRKRICSIQGLWCGRGQMAILYHDHSGRFLSGSLFKCDNLTLHPLKFVLSVRTWAGELWDCRIWIMIIVLFAWGPGGGGGGGMGERRVIEREQTCGSLIFSLLPSFVLLPSRFCSNLLYKES